jgi:hypothetical protein
MIKPNCFSLSTQKPARNQEISRILSAAVINSHFRSKLLNDPATTIAGGYSGESFSLGFDEQKKLGAIHASSLANFAAQLSEI